jgi:large subunit ribosomal protein L11
VLGQAGVNIPMFIKEFNAKTADQKGYVIPVIITVYSDKSFTDGAQDAAHVDPPDEGRRGGQGLAQAQQGQDRQQLPMSKVVEIAQKKLGDLNTDDLEAAIRTVRGTARSMGIEVG